MLCKNCGQQVEDGRPYCPNCGTPMAAAAQPAAQAPEHYNNGGLMAWSIISIFLCLITGIIALVQACGINSCTTVEAQKKKISACKTWCIVSTILGAISIIIALVAQAFVMQILGSLL